MRALPIDHHDRHLAPHERVSEEQHTAESIRPDDRGNAPGGVPDGELRQVAPGRRSHPATQLRPVGKHRGRFLPPQVLLRSTVPIGVQRLPPLPDREGLQSRHGIRGGYDFLPALRGCTAGGVYEGHVLGGRGSQVHPR